MDMLVKAVDLVVSLHRVDSIVQVKSQLVRLNLFILLNQELVFSKRKIEIAS